MVMPHKRVFEVPKEIYPFKDNWIEIDDLTLHYIDEGEGDVILFFHGNPTWSLLYRGMIPEMSKGYRCICVDYPGYGLSERPPKGEFDYLPETQSALMEKFVDKLGLKDITTFHQDWGGPIGLGLAGRRPELIKKLIIGNTWAFDVNSDDRLNSLRDFSLWMGSDENREKVINENLFLNMVTHLFRQGEERRNPENADSVEAAYNLPWSIPSWRYPTWISPNQIAAGIDYINEVEKGLSNLRDIPVLFFWGMQDKACSPGYYEKFREYFTNQRFVELPNASHFFQEDEPEIIVEEMKKFLKE